MRQLYRPIESSMKFDSPLCQTTKRYELLSIFPFYPSIDNRWKTNYFAFSSLEGSSGKLEGRGERRKRRKTCLFLDSLLISTKRIRGIRRGGGEGGRKRGGTRNFLKVRARTEESYRKPALGNGGRLSRWKEGACSNVPEGLPRRPRLRSNQVTRAPGPSFSHGRGSTPDIPKPSINSWPIPPGGPAALPVDDKSHPEKRSAISDTFSRMRTSQIHPRLLVSLLWCRRFFLFFFFFLSFC